ncbi:hypothetical protein [Hymenobacter saemangeumensis]|uniref:hypothetical protein n=1 Tax=Hymenobacter saemangeumensis TaxID=1084522 RepID=UPI0031EC49AA
MEKPLAFTVLLFFIEHMNRRNAIQILQQDLCLALDRQRNVISQAISILKQRRFIDSERNGSSVIYHVNAQVFWSAPAKEKALAFLDAPLKKAPVKRKVGITQKRRSVPVVSVTEKKSLQAKSNEASVVAQMPSSPPYYDERSLKQLIKELL